MSHNLLNNLLLPDGGSHSLSVAISARSGSGKTTLISKLIDDAVKMESFNETRFIYVSVKMEHYFGDSVTPVSDLDSLQKSLEKSRVGIFYPANPAEYENEVDNLIEMIFQMSDQNLETNFCVIVDDCNILKGFDSRGNPSPSMKKAIIAGRSKRIKLIPITHRLANLPRLFNGNLSGLLLMNMSLMDSEYAMKIFGMDFENLIEGLGDYRWAYVDLITEKVYKYEPVQL